MGKRFFNVANLRKAFCSIIPAPIHVDTSNDSKAPPNETCESAYTGETLCQAVPKTNALQRIPKCGKSQRQAP